MESNSPNNRESQLIEKEITMVTLGKEGFCLENQAFKLAGIQDTQPRQFNPSFHRLWFRTELLRVSEGRLLTSSLLLVRTQIRFQ